MKAEAYTPHIYLSRNDDGSATLSVLIYLPENEELGEAQPAFSESPEGLHCSLSLQLHTTPLQDKKMPAWRVKHALFELPFCPEQLQLSLRKGKEVVKTMRADRIRTT